jgi:hypothetical protein
MKYIHKMLFIEKYCVNIIQNSELCKQGNCPLSETLRLVTHEITKISSKKAKDHRTIMKPISVISKSNHWS